jgi:hypothetical protein
MQLQIHQIWKPISLIIMQNKTCTCHMLKLGMFAIFWSSSANKSATILLFPQTRKQVELCSSCWERARFGILFAYVLIS